MIIKPPTKPFDEYKWRWAEYTPTETLNQPACFLGGCVLFMNIKGSLQVILLF